MKKRQNNSTGTSVLRITLYVALILMSAILLVSGFKGAENWPRSTADGMEVPIPVADQAIATVGNATYSFSGSSEGTLTAASYKFVGKTWKAIAPYPVPIKSATAVSDRSRYVYIMNGASTDSIYQTAMYRYDPVTNDYTQMAPNTVGVRKPVVVFAGGKIYKMGGENASGYRTALEIYNIATNTWSLEAPLPTPVGAAWAKDNQIYTNLYRYDIATNTWSSDIPTSTWVTGDVIAAVGVGEFHVVRQRREFQGNDRLGH